MSNILPRRLSLAGIASAERSLVRVSSPFTAVAAGGIAAGIWEILKRSDDEFRRQIKSWLVTPVPPGAEAIEIAVRQATTAEFLAQDGMNTRRGAYPPFWSSEDRLVWNATSNTTQDVFSEGRHPWARARDGGGQVDNDHDDNEMRAMLSDVKGRICKAIDHFVWSPDEASTGNVGYRCDSHELPDLLDRIFGKFTPVGLRLIRLAPRMVELNRPDMHHFADANPISIVSPAGEQDTTLGNLKIALDGPFVQHMRFCIAVTGPAALLIDDQNRPHNAEGPFCVWPDGSGLFAIHGITVSSRIVEHPDTLSVTEIDRERNTEVRRVMIERFGHGRYLQEARARILDHHEGIGTLYQREIPNEEPLVMVEVINSTPEPDGSWKRYWLRVPPTMARAREAVAWTFGLSEPDYKLLVET